ncbi:hypothetical protein ACJX0J_019470, partial [Zea mays]
YNLNSVIECVLFQMKVSLSSFKGVELSTSATIACFLCTILNESTSPLRGHWTIMLETSMFIHEYLMLLLHRNLINYYRLEIDQVHKNAIIHNLSIQIYKMYIRGQCVKLNEMLGSTILAIIELALDMIIKTINIYIDATLI